jgi:hypothetical protein
MGIYCEPHKVHGFINGVAVAWLKRLGTDTDFPEMFSLFSCVWVQKRQF